VNLDGARILVAGGAHRVGKAVAVGLARTGAHVAISYFSSVGAAEETRDEIAAMGRRTAALGADAAVPAQMRELVRRASEALGGLDAYVHAPSGGFVAIAPEAIDELLWDTAMDSTAKGFMFGAGASYLEMRAQRRGVIVAITDVAGIQAWPKFAAHCAAKAAQIQLLKCLAAAWGAEGIRVCGVAPGPVLMPGHLGEESARHAASQTALGRLGSPQDVLAAVRFCLECEYVTGQNVIVDGGRMLAQ
jgi:NAD(P)-dependent dehydrogenase (short-subunit alcohol dehydrogenase family)